MHRVRTCAEDYDFISALIILKYINYYSTVAMSHVQGAFRLKQIEGS